MSQAYDGGKPAKNPTVEIWLKYYDADFYEALYGQGLLGLLKPRHTYGMTFLYPAEKSYREKIINTLNGEDALLGVSMVQALTIIRLKLETPSDWLEMKDNIPNALGQKVELSSTSTNKQVVLANGVSLSPNKDFAGRDNNIAVWDYKGTTDMPINGKPAEFVKAQQSQKPSRKSGHAKGGNGMLAVPDKCMLARRLEDQALCLIKKDKKEFETCNPFTSAMVSFAQYLKEKSASCLETFNEMCEPNSVATFYAILLPYTSKSVLEEEIKDWLKNTRAVCLEANPNGFWANYVTGLGNAGHKHLEELEENKSRISSATALSMGKALYTKHYGDKASLRIKGDELRFLINTTMRSDLVETEMSQMFLDIKIMYSPESSNNFFLLVPDTRTDPVFGSTGVAFVSSRCFMSVPNPKPNGVQTVTFKEALDGTGEIDPDVVFITDDAKYLAQTESTGDFISGLKALLNSMPAGMKKTLLDELSST
jgi:hypothetical protein